MNESRNQSVNQLKKQTINLSIYQLMATLQQLLRDVCYKHRCKKRFLHFKIKNTFFNVFLFSQRFLLIKNVGQQFQQYNNTQLKETCFFDV